MERKGRGAAKEKPRLQSSDCLEGRFVVRSVLGEGKAGGAVYLAQACAADCEDPVVAIKYPATHEEIEALKAIACASPPCVGLPRLLGAGHHNDKKYVAIQVMGKTLSEVFRRLERRPRPARWAALCVIGRWLLRTLEDLHRCGYVHNDVQPDNILMGDLGGDAVGRSRPFLVDFGCARRFPGGGHMKEDWGSVDFNSIRSAHGGRRGPWDDLESLGWVLAHGFYGELPWFEVSRETCWSGKGLWDFAFRSGASRKVADIKEALLTKGWSGLGERWAHFEGTIPEGLVQYLLLCKERSGGWWGDADQDGVPDYAALRAALGSTSDGEAADEEDWSDFQRCAELLS